MAAPSFASSKAASKVSERDVRNFADQWFGER